MICGDGKEESDDCGSYAAGKEARQDEDDEGVDVVLVMLSDVLLMADERAEEWSMVVDDVHRSQTGKDDQGTIGCSSEGSVWVWICGLMSVDGELT